MIETKMSDRVYNQSNTRCFLSLLLLLYYWRYHVCQMNELFNRELFGSPGHNFLLIETGVNNPIRY